MKAAINTKFHETEAMSHFHAWPQEIVCSPFRGLQQRREFRVPGWLRWT